MPHQRGQVARYSVAATEGEELEEKHDDDNDDDDAARVEREAERLKKE